MTRPALDFGANAEIKADGRQRHQIQTDIKRKEKARETLCKRYASRQLSSEEVHLCIVSLADNNTFLAFNRDPVDSMLRCGSMHRSSCEELGLLQWCAAVCSSR